jgi:hypothetical protein
MGLWSKLASLGAMAGGGALMATGVGGPLGAALIGAGIGGAKDQFLDRPQALAQAERANEANKYSRWSGIQHQMPNMPSLGNNMLQGGGAGLTYGMMSAKGGADGAVEAAKNAKSYSLGSQDMGKELMGIGNDTSAEAMKLAASGYSPWSTIMPNTSQARFTMGRYNF